MCTYDYSDWSVSRSFGYRWPELRSGGERKNLVQLKPRSEINGLLNTGVMTTADPTRIRMTVNGQAMICWVLPIYDELALLPCSILAHVRTEVSLPKRIWI